MNRLLAVAIMVCVALAFAEVAQAQDGLAVIVNASAGVTELSKSEVADVFTGTKTTLGSATAKLFILMPDQAVSQTLFEKILNTTAVKFNQQWLRKTFSGGGSAPTRLQTSAELIKAVSSTPGGVGYIPKSDAAGATGVKVVFNE